MIWIFKLLKQKRGTVLLTCLLLFLQTLGTLMVPTLTANMINFGVATGNIPYILATGGQMILVSLLSAGCAIVAAYQSGKLASFAGKELRISLFTKVQTLSLQTFDSVGSSSMLTRSTGDIIQIQQGVLFVFQFLLPVPFMVLSGLLLGVTKDKVLTAVLVGLMLLYMVYGYLIGKRMVPITRQMQVKMDAINRTLLERLSGVRVIRAFHRMAYEQEKFTNVATQYADTAISLNKVYAVTYGFVMLTMNMILVLFLWLGGVRITMGVAKVGDIMAFVEYATLILSTLNMGIMTVIYLFRAKASVERVREILTVPPHEPEPAEKSSTGESTIESLTFEGVSFGYDGAEELVLKEVSFTAHRGETTAIIGSTGSGKSTLLQLICGFYAPQSGSLQMNGVNINTLSSQQLREKIGYVPQKAFLFSGSVAENIAYGNENAKFSAIVSAAQIAQAEEFILTLPEGYDTLITQGGSNLSGGQKQRLAIARAVVKQPDLYLLDDSFSALDFRTDSQLRKALRQHSQNSIVIVVAQRIRSIQEAQQIVVLDQGRVVGVGTHQELLQSCHVYQQIAKSQLLQEEKEG